MAAKTQKVSVVFLLATLPFLVGAVVYALRLEARLDVHATKLEGADKVFVEVKAQNRKVIEQYDRINRRLSRIEGRLSIRSPRGHRVAPE